VKLGETDEESSFALVIIADGELQQLPAPQARREEKNDDEAEELPAVGRVAACRKSRTKLQKLCNVGLGEDIGSNWLMRPREA
jgi:hypothetical protein